MAMNTSPFDTSSKGIARVIPRRTTMQDRLHELREELEGLMAEQIASLQAQTFGVFSEEELREQTERLSRIRELSAEWLRLLEIKKGSSRTS
jgi:hypothetical protein